MPREVDVASTSWSDATTFPRTSTLPRRSQSHNESLLADHDGELLFHPHGSVAEVRTGAASQQLLRAVSFAGALSTSATSSLAGLLLADVMPAGSHAVPSPRAVKDVSVAAQASAARSANALQVLSGSALSVPPATPRATSATVHTAAKGLTSTSRPFCSVVGGYSISPKLAELLREAVTREDEDAPFVNIPAELLWWGGRRDAPSALHSRRGDPGTTTPRKGVVRASPSSRVFLSADEALMMGPDAPRPGRQRWSYKIRSAPWEGTNTSFASAALRPLTPLSGSTGSTVPFISLFTKEDAVSMASPLTMACMTAAPLSITSPPSPGGAMVCSSTPKSPLSGAEPAVASALLRGSRFAVKRSLRSSDAQSTLMAAIVTGPSHAAPGALSPLSPFTPSDFHGGGGQQMELPMGFQGLSAYSHHLLEQHMPVSSRGSSSRTASTAATTSLLELARRAASVASAQSMSDCTDAPYHFEDLLDDATASSLSEDDDVLRDTLCGGDFSCDVFEDGKMCEAVGDNDCDESSGFCGLFQIRRRRMVAAGAMLSAATATAAAAGSASRLSPSQQLTRMQGHCNAQPYCNACAIIANCKPPAHVAHAHQCQVRLGV